MGSEEISSKLHSVSPTGYEENSLFNTHLLEQYKLYQSSAEKISDRRQTANSFFVTINTFLISLIGYLNFGMGNSSKSYWVISCAGLAISFMWCRLVRSYKDLNSAKFKVIHEIEKKLPISPYDAEWEYLSRGENPKLYLPFTHIEIYIPWVFIVLHASVPLLKYFCAGHS